MILEFRGQYSTSSVEWGSLDEPTSDHSCGRSEGSLGRHALQQNEFLSSSSFSSSCSSLTSPPHFLWNPILPHITPLLSVKTIQKCGTGFFSFFPLSHGFPLTSLKFSLADYNIVKETQIGRTLGALAPCSKQAARQPLMAWMVKPWWTMTIQGPAWHPHAPQCVSCQDIFYMTNQTALDASVRGK